MNIAMFTDAYWPRVNGVTVSVDSFSRALIKAGHRVLVVCSSYPHNAETGVSEMDDGQPGAPEIVRVPSLPLFLSKEDRIAKLNKVFWVSKMVQRFVPDVVHINSEFVIAEFGFQYALLHNIPAIYTFHTLWEDYAPNYVPFLPPILLKMAIRPAQRIILNRSYKVIVPTPQIEEVVKRDYKCKKEIFRLPTGIDESIFIRSDDETAAFRSKLEERFPVLKNKRILLFAGRVAKEKNIGFLFKILPDILKQAPDTVLLVAGNGPDLEELKAQAIDEGVSENCAFSGYMDRRDLALCYALSDVFVFPSLTDTQGLVTLEAMLSGTPVVAIGVMGTIQVMGGDNGGFMVKNDPEEFKSRVLQLLSDDELYRRKAAEAREHAKAWSLSGVTEKLIDIYTESIKSYEARYGEKKVPIWEQLGDKQFWKTHYKHFWKMSSAEWRRLVKWEK